MIKFDLKALEASAVLTNYLEKIYSNKRWDDWKKILFVHIQLNRLESENYRAKELINEKDRKLVQMDLQIRQMKIELSAHRTNNDKLKVELENREKTIENLTEGLVARCDQCGS